jgi:hypothetical protein
VQVLKSGLWKSRPDILAFFPAFSGLLFAAVYSSPVEGIRTRLISGKGRELHEMTNRKTSFPFDSMGLSFVTHAQCRNFTSLCRCRGRRCGMKFVLVF